ncbi:sec23-binding domain of sec16 domain-containing protein [Ditylenchus destructor]|uniref:Protein transport protein sec16 n=1 Tax=Ditylenchus destructor TaxID=166010 RepID=A0AAD4R6I0_9BILA|nr:sec23-binding domain of sec16 domain-containing protein [Ditylenchus destructor]
MSRRNSGVPPRTTGDFGESFVERERQFRFRKAATGGRAKSEVGEALSHGNGRNRDYRSSFYRNVNNSSFQSGVSAYSRPRSSFEPASSSTNAAARVLKSRPDDWYEVQRRYTARENVPMNQPSSEEELDDPTSDLYEDEEGEDSRDELSSYNFRPIQPPSARNTGTGYYSGNTRGYAYGRTGAASKKSVLDFDDREVYYFGVVQLSLERARSILATNPPPAEYRDLNPIEKTAYLYYFTLYRKYLTPVVTFKNVFNREFYKYTCQGSTEDVALWKICKHTQEEYKQKIIKRNQEAYKLSQKHLFSDERDTPDSRTSDRPSFCDQESDINSLESASKEPLLYRIPHKVFKFAVGGRVIVLDPETSVSTIRIEDAKKFFLDPNSRRNVEALESFKGPLILGDTQPHSISLFIERQIDRILQSDVYRCNPNSGDANDGLLIWRLLETLVHQHGKVTGPDLARLLMSGHTYSARNIKASQFIRGKSDNVYESNGNSSGNDTDDPSREESKVAPYAMDRFTRFLLGGHVEEAIESAMKDGLFFDALLLAHRMFRNDRRKLDEIEAKLLNRRKLDHNHPTMTLISVAAEIPVPLLTNITTDDASGWRAHIAIVLANLQTQTAIDTVYQLGLALAGKEFNSAADFCFLVVNLLTGYDCFRPPQGEITSDEEKSRKYIKLISASLPDDELHSTVTRFGWSILDFQATEIFEYAQKLSNPSAAALSHSIEFQKCRLEYATLLSEYGGFNANVSQYCTEVARAIWDHPASVDRNMIEELCDMAERFHHISNRGTEDQEWIAHLRTFIGSQPTHIPTAHVVHPQAQVPHKASVADDNQSQYSSMSNYFGGRPAASSSPIPMMEKRQEPIQNVSQQQQKISQQHQLQRQTSKSSGHHPAARLPRTRTVSQESVPSSPPGTRSRNESFVESNIIPEFPTMGIDIKPIKEHKDDVEQISPSRQHHAPIPNTHSATALFPPNQAENIGMTQMASPNNTHSFYSNIPAASSPYDHHQMFVPRGESQEEDVHSPFSIGGPLTANNDYEESNSPFITSDYMIPNPEPPAPQETHHQNNDSLNAHSQRELPKTQPKEDANGNEIKPKETKSSPKSGGMLAGLVKKFIPQNKEMILPDDSNPSLRYDPQLQRWVGEGVEEEEPPPPPPTFAQVVPHSNTAQGEQQAVPPQMFNTFSLAAVGAPQPGAQPSVKKPLKNRYQNAFH